LTCMDLKQVRGLGRTGIPGVPRKPILDLGLPLV
jgi:hypothetical protein